MEGSFLSVQGLVSGLSSCMLSGQVFSPISLSMSGAHSGQDKAGETQRGHLRFCSPSPTEACLNPETLHKVSSLISILSIPFQHHLDVTFVTFRTSVSLSAKWEP